MRDKRLDRLFARQQQGELYIKNPAFLAGCVLLHRYYLPGFYSYVHYIFILKICQASVFIPIFYNKRRKIIVMFSTCG